MDGVDEVDSIGYFGPVTEAFYLTVEQVAEELRITPSGVYKLIQRKKIPVVRHSERGIRITRWALDAYKRRIAATTASPLPSRPAATWEPLKLRDAFQAETGLAPEEWIARWKAELIPDTPESAATLVRAIGLRDPDLHATERIVPALDPQASRSRPGVS